MYPVISNMVVTCTSTVKVDLAEVADKIWNSVYNPKRMKAFIVKLQKPAATVFFLGTGKMVCNGAKSMIEAKRCLRIFCRRLVKCGYETARVRDVKISNIVCTSTLPFIIDILKLAEEMQGIHEPELFPYTSLKYKNPDMWVLINRSAKVILRGGKSYEDVKSVAADVLPKIKKYHKFAVINFEVFKNYEETAVNNNDEIFREIM